MRMFARLSLTSLLLVGAWFGSARAGGEDRASHAEIRWNGPAGESAQGIVLRHSTATETRLRLLVVTPQGERLILTHVFQPRQGLFLYEIVDDESGWWFCLRQQWGLTFADVEAASVDAFLAMAKAGDSSQSITLSGASISEVAHASTLSDPDILAATGRLVRQANPDGLGMPKAVREGWMLLQSVPRGDAAAVAVEMFTPLMDVLAAASQTPATVQVGAWQADPQPLRRGLTLGPEVGELLASFERFEITAPFAEVRPGTPTPRR
jgi:hypothetical protein